MTATNTNNTGKYKLFRDPVHNYIQIPDSICSDFIDTYLFQRLRAIEQTSMRCLYPGARHDRFIHSLGTYHLATKIYAVIEKDIKEHCSSKSEDKEKENKKYKNTFLIAALLHDCAHSPFSHTGEKFIDTFCKESLIKDINSFFKNSKYPEDLGNSQKHPNSHELASAYVGAKYFSEEFKKYDVNPEQFARMITGIKNHDKNDNDKTIYNFLIQLINGYIFDVDRLDYLFRDTWASGVSNAQVDLERLLNGIKLNWNSGEIEIKNQSLSSLINTIKARDFIYQWIIPHHKVAYSDYILHNAIEELITKLNESDTNAEEKMNAGAILFSPERFFEKAKIKEENIFMPTDGDIIYLIKKYCTDKKSATQQVLTRKDHLSPIWKSVAEFVNLFPPPSDIKEVTDIKKKTDALKAFYKLFCGNIQEYLKNECNLDENDFLVLEPQKIKTTEAELLNVKIVLENSKTNLDSINLENILPEIKKNRDDTFYFFVYLKKNLLISSPIPIIDIEQIKNIYNNTIKEKFIIKYEGII